MRRVLVEPKCPSLSTVGRVEICAKEAPSRSTEEAHSLGDEGHASCSRAYSSREVTAVMSTSPQINTMK